MKGATSIQERLWELRKDKGLNLEELSKLTGISKSALGSYEKEDFKEINHGQPYHAGRLLWGFRRLSAVPDREQGADQHATDGAAFER